MRIAVSGLRARGYHGVLETERRDGQLFVVDAALTLDRAPVSDDLAETVDYAALSTGLVGVVEGEPVALIETLAARLLDVCLADPRVAEAEVTVHKPQAPIAAEFGDVTVTLAGSRAR